jgi:mannonate dehydratase
MSYSVEVVEKADEYFTGLGTNEIDRLTKTFLLGFPGSGESFSLKEVKLRIEAYGGINKADYQSNLMEFLREIVPVAEENNVKMAIHPDDPPWPLLGLPRAVSDLQDLDKIMNTVDSQANGITFCTGSFGAAHTNDLPEMAKKLSHRINFLHLRNVSRDSGKNFREEDLFAGDVNISSIVKTMVLEDIKRSESDPGHAGIPVRPDHGARILGDFNETHYPGYSLYGRMKNLAEIRGLEKGIRDSLAS